MGASRSGTLSLCVQLIKDGGVGAITTDEQIQNELDAGAGEVADDPEADAASPAGDDDGVARELSGRG